MCGISGFVDFSKNSNETLLRKMSDTLIHRGPDGSGASFIETLNSQIGLAHRRLSIIDLSSAGKQPMQLLNLTITFNGEIYNFKEIKTELEKLNHVFLSHSDTEVILHAYKEWGTDCLSRFVGMFAFVIYDSDKQELVCCRDRTGIKPFYYYQTEHLFLFASELKAFHVHPGFKKEINLNSLAAFMQFGNVPAPHCIFKNCYKLEPGTYLKLSLPSCETELKKYWNVYTYYNQEKLDISFQEAKIETEKILISAFEYRLVSDVPVGVFLSGGYDSTCLTALIQKNTAKKIKTFTIGIEKSGLDEAPFAKTISNHLGTEHQEYYCTQKDALELIPKLPYYYDEPFGDYSAIPTMLVCKMARRDVTVALSADGGDEVFAGYNRYSYLMKYGSLLNTIPGSLRNTTSYLMKKIPFSKLPVLKNRYNFHNRYNKLRVLLQDPSPKNIMHNLSTQFSADEFAELFYQGTELPSTAYASRELRKEFFSPLAYMMAIDYQTYLPDDILQKVDRASMAFGLEAREPFLDHRIIEWASRLPDNFKYHNGVKKFMVRELVHDYIPKKLMDRTKMGFTIPLEDWLLQDLKPQIEFHLSEQKIKTQGIFNSNAVQKLVRDFYSGKKEFTLKIWYLLMFQMWYAEWMD